MSFVKPFMISIHFFIDPSFPLNKHSSVCCHISKEDFFIAPAKEIKKVFLIKISENRTFINFTTLHIFLLNILILGLF